MNFQTLKLVRCECRLGCGCGCGVPRQGPEELIELRQVAWPGPHQAGLAAEPEPVLGGRVVTTGRDRLTVPVPGS